MSEKIQEDLVIETGAASTGEQEPIFETDAFTGFEIDEGAVLKRLADDIYESSEAGVR